jgi:hypothetical protein
VKLTYVLVKETSNYFHFFLLADVDDVVFSVYSIARVVECLTSDEEKEGKSLATTARLIAIRRKFNISAQKQ